MEDGHRIVLRPLEELAALPERDREEFDIGFYSVLPEQRNQVKHHEPRTRRLV